MGFNQWKVSYKLVLGFASVIAFSVAVGVVGITQIKKIDALDTMLYEKGAMPLLDMSEASTSFQRIRVNLRDAIRATKTEDIERFTNRVKELDKALDESLKKIEASMMTDEGRKLVANTEAKAHAFGVFAEKISQFAKLNKDVEAYAVLEVEAMQANKEFQTALDELEANKSKAAKAIADSNTVTANFATTMMITMLAVGSLFAFIFAWYISGGITGLLTKVSDSHRTSSEQVASAAEQLSSASTQLSSSSSEQASAIQETSSSLEELNGMVQANVGSAEQAFELANKVKQISDEGNNTMIKLEAAMQEILESNRKIEALVSVIGNIGEKTQVMDEIVFQTKLLSFNASVEAERAGEHGRGFAVVAQEVGNLAQMSGKAAQEIATIVKDSITNAQAITTENKKKVDQGSVYVSETAASLKEITAAATTVSSGAKQVLDASKDQAKGITQISTAMTQVDKATQENAATAEEAASSSEELSAQTEVLHDVVGELMAMVHGVGATAARTSKASEKRQAEPQAAQPQNSKVVRLTRTAKPTYSAPKKMAAGYNGPLADDHAPAANGGNDPWEKL
jgi:methyl-accepting chemotaxis protein